MMSGNDSMNNDDNYSDDDDDDKEEAQEEEEDEESESSPSKLRRRRDRIMDWMSSSSSATAAAASRMVRSSRTEEERSANKDNDNDNDNGLISGKRVKANFGNLFAGMPSMSEILNADESSSTTTTTTTTTTTSTSSTMRSTDNGRNTLNNNPTPPFPTQNSDDSWFDQERREIEQTYRQMEQKMIETLERERKQDPKSVPSNAQAMIRDVLRQEMETELAATKDRLAQERLEAYSHDRRQAVENQNVVGVSNQVVDNLRRQDEEAQARADAAQARIDDYRRYELEAFLKKPDQEMSKVTAPSVGQDLDQWALERLQERLDGENGNCDNNEDDDDSNLLLNDILEERLEDLQERIEQNAGKSSIRPETMKEWQMYRAISSRLKAAASAGRNGEERTDTENTDLKNDEVTEEQIVALLESWKSYLSKEDVMRKRSGLTRGPKLPFEWQESGRDEAIKQAQIKAALVNGSPGGQIIKSRVEIRKDVNRKSLEALERLIQTSDPIRSARLKKDVDLLRTELEANDYLDVDESTLEELEPVLAGPVDISDVFTSERDPQYQTAMFMKRNGGGGEKPPPPSTPFFDEPVEDSTPGTPFFDNSGVSESTQPLPPSTPFFSERGDDETFTADLLDTPPFSSQDETDSEESSEGFGYRLGSIEEQKLRSMYQRAGARTDEEKAVIRAQWEDFQKFEQSKRDGSGLSGDNGSSLMSQANLKYDVSEITNADGDFDAEKILSTIGPRPTRKRKPTGNQKEQDSDQPSSLNANLDAKEVSDSLYRAVSAVGGGRTKDDPEAKAREKAAFDELLAKENEMRRLLDEMDDEFIAEARISEEGDFDDARYAGEVLRSLGERPKKRRKISEAEYSDEGLALSDSDDEDDEDNVDEDDVKSEAETLSPKMDSAPIDKLAQEDELMPSWFRKERASASSNSGERGGILGSDLDDVFDDDVYEHNQRQLAEYERRRSGGKKQMGIDISDVLGRSSDDYADYTYDDDYLRGRRTGWGTGNFDSRKANLLEYIELDAIEVNALMDLKDSVQSTGVSRYLPRINKPFKEFGAIFRLEGVLLDTTGFQFKAWTKVAEEKGFKPPTIEDVRRASVLRPDVAIREAFFWTDDIVLCGEIAAAHKNTLQEVFDEWMKEASITPPNVEREAPPTALSILTEEAAPIQPPPAANPLADLSEGERIRLYRDAWSRTAATHRLASPSREQVEVASVLSPEIAVRKAFQWTNDFIKIDQYVATYRSILRELSGGADESVSEKKLKQPESPPPRKILDETTMLELSFKAWTQLAEENDFELPLPEEVMAAVVINDPAIAIQDGFGWCDDSSRIPGLVKTYEQALDDLLREWRGESKREAAPIPVPEQQTRIEDPQPIASHKSGPTEEEKIEMQSHAWASAALNHGFQKPLTEKVQLAMKMTPEEAITRLYNWTSDPKTIAAICATYDSALHDISVKYIQKYNLPPNTALFPRHPVILTKPQAPVSEAEEVFQVAWDAWNTVAMNNGYERPDEDQVLFALSVGIDDAIISGFEWASEPDDVNRIIAEYREELKDWHAKRSNRTINQPAADEALVEMPMFKVVPGADHWLRSLLEVDMQCAIVSHMSREQVDVLLEVSGLSSLVGPRQRVTASNNYVREVDQLLGAALRVERRPDHCVVFDSSPQSSVAAHDLEMRSVAVVGAFPRYDLLTADSTAASFDELTAMNIRRLFAERVYDQPMADIQQADPVRNTRAKTKYRWEGDD